MCSRIEEMVRMRWRLGRFVKISMQPLLLLFIVIILGFLYHFFTTSGNNGDFLPSYSKAFSYVSVCSGRADKRGPNQKIVSYSIYGNFSNPGVVNRYLKPLIETVNQVSAIYPGMNKF